MIFYFVMGLVMALNHKLASAGKTNQVRNPNKRQVFWAVLFLVPTPLSFDTIKKAGEVFSFARMNNYALSPCKF